MKPTTLAKIWFVLAISMLTTPMFMLVEPMVMDPQDVRTFPFAIKAVIFIQPIFAIPLLLAASQSVRAGRILKPLIMTGAAVLVYSIIAGCVCVPTVRNQFNNPGLIGSIVVGIFPFAPAVFCTLLMRATCRARNRATK